MRRTYKTVEVDVDICLSEFDSDELRDELKSRGEDMPSEQSELCKQALDKLYVGNTREAITLLERALYPKWDDTAECRALYEKALSEKPVTVKPAYRGAGDHAHS
jgi:hypothetical protein